MVNIVYNRDCMEAMAEMPDKCYELAIVDPEYGIGASEMNMGTGNNKKWQKGKKWDTKTPDKEYFTQLLRVSKNQIIWGGNYFADKLPVSRGWIYWDKLLNKEVSFADGELAWSSFDVCLKKAKIQYSGFLGSDSDKIHPTQKPVKLYKWLLTHYAKPGDKILDTHIGSGSIRIACDILGYDLTGYEIDKDYFEAQELRFQRHKAQGSIFEVVQAAKPLITQQSLF